MEIKKILAFVVLFALLISCKRDHSEIEFETDMNKSWQIQSSSNINVNGDKISSINFKSDDWYETKLPSTVLNSLVKNNIYKDIYFADNLKRIPVEQFKVPWWYRKEFKIDEFSENEHYRLVFEGINYKANIWLNGKLLVDSQQIESPFRIFDINITDYINSENNVIALEVIPPKKDDLTIGFVDWNPHAPDENMGLWRGVKLLRSKSVSLKNAFVLPDLNVKTLNEASLTIKADLTNYSDIERKVTLEGIIGDLKFSKDFTLNAEEEKTVELLPEEIKELNIKNPKLWWPNNLGEQNLYDLSLKVIVDNKISDKSDVRFGIRKVEAYKNENGHKGFKINGKKILIRGAGWVDDLLLSDSPEKVDAQMLYAKHMNLNCIRLEGFWGNDKTIYEKADEYGILLMVGWSCHWEWEDYCHRTQNDTFMCIYSDKDIELQSLAFKDQVVWLRNHPSVFLWTLGSDKLPVPKLEAKLKEYFDTYDTTRPYIASCRRQAFGTDLFYNSEVSGPVAVKMIGPYGYVTPNYWYEDTILGGAFGFNTETGPGPQVPPIESIKRMIPEAHLWPINEMWDYHAGRSVFGTLDRFLKAFNARYGEAKSLEEFASKVQISNYEAIRAMFEAFTVNKHDATGIIQWMYNSAWPETFWQLFDWYLMPNGSFYGTKKACQPLNLIYNYKDHTIYAANDYLETFKNGKAEVKIFDINSKQLLSESIQIDIDENSSKMIFDIPEIKDLTKTYFLDLRLYDENNKLISNNFYWLSTQKDVLDYKKSEWYITPNKNYADFKLLNNLPEANISATHKILSEGDNKEIEVQLTNQSNTIAFFIELQLKNKDTGLSVLPIFWEDNYVSLLPGETRTVKAHFKSSGNNFVFSFIGFS